jgi:hypothetical protein
MKRKNFMAPLKDEEIPPVLALGRQITEQAAERGELPPARFGDRARQALKPAGKN